ncbi:MAG: hypothetical protein ACR2MX_03635 [Cyclobacteriaceae bacterium]
MKKLWLIPVLCAITYVAYGQTRAGLKLAPDLNFNRVIATSDTLQFSSQGAGARFIFGPVFDFPLGSKQRLLHLRSIIFAQKSWDKSGRSGKNLILPGDL